MRKIIFALVVLCTLLSSSNAMQWLTYTENNTTYLYDIDHDVILLAYSDRVYAMNVTICCNDTDFLPCYNDTNCTIWFTCEESRVLSFIS